MFYEYRVFEYPRSRRNSWISLSLALDPSGSGAFTSYPCRIFYLLEFSYPAGGSEPSWQGHRGHPDRAIVDRFGLRPRVSPRSTCGTFRSRTVLCAPSMHVHVVERRRSPEFCVCVCDFEMCFCVCFVWVCVLNFQASRVECECWNASARRGVHILALTRYCKYFIAIKGVVGKIYCAIL